MHVPQHVFALLRACRDEGSKTAAYLDSEGKLTIGVGHLIVKDDGYTKDTVLSNEQVTALFEKDLLRHIPAAVKFVAPHSWSSLPLEAQKVLLNMAFNLGSNLMQFKKAAGAVRDHKWTVAAAEFKNSKWCKQVKGRCTRLTARLAAISDKAPASGAPANCDGSPEPSPPKADDTTPIDKSKKKPDDSHSCSGSECGSCSGSGCGGAASASPSPKHAPKAHAASPSSSPTQKTRAFASPSRTPSRSPAKSEPSKDKGALGLGDKAKKSGGGDAHADSDSESGSSNHGASKYAACAVHGSAAAQRDALVAAANTLVKSAADGHYSQDAVKRWGGITDKIKPPKAPAYSDCSSSATW
jgi:lysozyme